MTWWRGMNQDPRVCMFRENRQSSASMEALNLTQMWSCFNSYSGFSSMQFSEGLGRPESPKKTWVRQQSHNKMKGLKTFTGFHVYSLSPKSTNSKKNTQKPDSTWKTDRKHIENPASFARVGIKPLFHYNVSKLGRYRAASRTVSKETHLTFSPHWGLGKDQWEVGKKTRWSIVLVKWT